MKIFLSLILLFTFTVYSRDSRTISIVKNHQNEFEIISDGKTIYKYNKGNCDSLTIYTLNEIYLKASKDSSMSTKVTILNLPQENKTDWVPFALAALAILGTFFSGFYANRWSSKSQTDHYNRQIRAENKRQWLEELRRESVGIVAFNLTVSSNFEALEKHKSGEKKLKIEELETFNKELSEYGNNIVSKILTFQFMLHAKRHAEIRELFDNIVLARADYRKAKLLISELINKIQALIDDEQDKLDRGEF